MSKSGTLWSWSTVNSVICGQASYVKNKTHIQPTSTGTENMYTDSHNAPKPAKFCVTYNIVFSAHLCYLCARPKQSISLTPSFTDLPHVIALVWAVLFGCRHTTFYPPVRTSVTLKGSLEIEYQIIKLMCFFLQNCGLAKVNFAGHFFSGVNLRYHR